MINFFTQSTKFRSFILHLGFCLFLAYVLSGALPLPFIAWWFIVANIFEFLMFGKDKLRAKWGWSRTPESTFLTMGLLGAFAGIFAGRWVFNHKTSKMAFIIPMWILFIAQVVFAAVYVESITVKNSQFAKYFQSE